MLPDLEGIKVPNRLGGRFLVRGEVLLEPSDWQGSKMNSNSALLGSPQSLFLNS